MRRKETIGLSQRVDLQGLPWGIGGGAVPDPYADYLMYDTFTDVNGTDLNVHVPEKGAWTEVDTGGLCDIQGNKAQITGNGYLDPKFYAGPFARAVGLELVFTLKPYQTNTQLAVGLWSGINLDPVAGNREHLMWFFSTGVIYCREAGLEGPHGPYTTAERESRIVLKAVGAEYWYNGVMIANLAVSNGDPLYIGAAGSVGGTWDFDIITYG